MDEDLCNAERTLPEIEQSTSCLLETSRSHDRELKCDGDMEKPLDEMEKMKNAFAESCSLSSCTSKLRPSDDFKQPDTSNMELTMNSDVSSCRLDVECSDKSVKERKAKGKGKVKKTSIKKSATTDDDDHGTLYDDQETLYDFKKSRLRTASDVISRIRWDSELPAENFRVGYIDRFVGLLEKPFQFFSWEGLAQCDDHDVLAIPEHRIRYFKYHDTKVWDKHERLDLVFGSADTDQQTDFHKLVELLEEDFRQKMQQKQENTAETNDHFGGSDDDDDDEEDNVEIQMAEDADVLDNCDSCHDGIIRPNYFVAVRITNPDVIAKASEVKGAICAKDPRLADLLMPNEMLHITMAMLRLEDPAEVACAIRAIEECRTSLADFFKDPATVHLKGLDTFCGRVLYVQVKAPPKFYEFHNLLLKHLQTSGILLTHKFKYVPHMTLLKLTKSRTWLLKNPYIDPYTYMECKDCDLGTQLCDNLNLCIIGESKRLDGFYHCEAELCLNK